MSGPRVISGKLPAWFTSEWVGPDDLNGSPQDSIGKLSFYIFSDTPPANWSRAGDAQITVTLDDEKTLIANKIEALRGELQKVRADASVKATTIKSEIQNLLAISYEPGAAS